VPLRASVPAMSSFLRAACCARESWDGGAVGGEEEGMGVAPPRERRVATMVLLVVLAVEVEVEVLDD
jgi:hypothetical protein